MRANAINSCCVVCDDSANWHASGSDLSDKISFSPILAILADHKNYAWLNEAPRLTRGIRQAADDWIELAEFHSVELEGVDLNAKNLGPIHPFTWLVLETRRDRRQDFVIKRLLSKILNSQFRYQIAEAARIRIFQPVALVIGEMETARAAQVRRNRMALADRLEWISDQFNEMAVSIRAFDSEPRGSIAGISNSTPK